MNNLSVDGCRLEILGAGRLATTTDEVRAAFPNMWIESKLAPCVSVIGPLWYELCASCCPANTASRRTDTRRKRSW
jgi:hypothetical protein